MGPLLPTWHGINHPFETSIELSALFWSCYITTEQITSCLIVKKLAQLGHEIAKRKNVTLEQQDFIQKQEN
jgi:hypothetical protein